MCVTLPATGPITPAQMSWWARVRMRSAASAEITELTRDRAREGRVCAEAAVHLAPSPAWILELLPRVRRRQP